MHSSTGSIEVVMNDPESGFVGQTIHDMDTENSESTCGATSRFRIFATQGHVWKFQDVTFFPQLLHECAVQLLYRNVQQERGGLVCKAHIDLRITVL